MRVDLGVGAYGVVHFGHEKKTNEEVAIKEIKLKNEEQGIPATSIREISLLRELNHDNIVK